MSASKYAFLIAGVLAAGFAQANDSAFPEHMDDERPWTVGYTHEVVQGTGSSRSVTGERQADAAQAPVSAPMLSDTPVNVDDNNPAASWDN